MRRLIPGPTAGLPTDDECKATFGQLMPDDEFLGSTEWGRKYNSRLFCRDYKIDVNMCFYFSIGSALGLADVVYIAPEKNYNNASVIPLVVSAMSPGGALTLKFQCPCDRSLQSFCFLNKSWRSML